MDLVELKRLTLEVEEYREGIKKLEEASTSKEPRGNVYISKSMGLGGFKTIDISSDRCKEIILEELVKERAELADAEERLLEFMASTIEDDLIDD
jgi:hypothetical protein